MSDRGGRGRGGGGRGFQGSFRGSRGGGSDRGGRGGRGGGGGFRGGRGGAPPNDSRSKAYRFVLPRHVQRCPDTDTAPSAEGRVPGPDSAVTKLEDEILEMKKSSVKGVTAQLGSLSIQQKDDTGNVFPYRPAFGSSGKGVILWANYFPVHVKAEYIYKYELEFKEEGREDSKKGKEPGGSKDIRGRKLHLAVQQVLRELASQNKKIALASQFKNQIVSSEKLEMASNPLSIQIPPESEDQTPDTLSVTIRGPVEIRVADLVSYTRSMDDHGERTTYPKFPEVIDALDIILGHNARSKLGQVTSVGSSRLFPFGKDKATASLMQNYRALIAARGFFQSARIGTGRLLLNTNITHGVFRVSGKLNEIMNNLQIQPVSQDNYRLKKLVGAFAKFLPKTRVWATFSVANGTKARRSKALNGMVNRLTGTMAEGPNRPQIEPGWEYPGPKNIKFWLTDDDGSRYITVHDYYKKSRFNRDRQLSAGSMLTYP